MELLRDFKKIDKNNVSLAGGKGASLGEMTKAGIPVPHGFVILSSAFEKFLEETDLNVEIDAILDSVNHKEMHTVEHASEKIEALILGAVMPKEIEEEVQKFFKNLDSQYVAVRSSATAEDSASAAWAGQLESYLNTNEENLLGNVKKCWASLFTPRAIFYRFEKDLHKQEISVAVVVQKMIESEKSGIAFSVHPVTQDRNQVIIEAGFGLGEAIVSGQITPDSYVVKKQPREIIDKNIQTQSRGLYRAEKGGNEWQNIGKEKGEIQVLSDKEILELSEIILRIENHYNFPCDIEWAFEKGKFYIVQSRPITTLNDEQINQHYLVKKFLSEIKNDDVIVWEGPYSPLCLLFCWNNQDFYESSYNIPASPALMVISGRDTKLAFNNTYYVNYAKEVFERYWKDQEIFAKRNNKCLSLREKIDVLYTKIQNEDLAKISEKQLIKWVSDMNYLLGDIESLSIFVETFDKDVALSVIGVENKKWVENIWEKATHPVFESFEIRRLKISLERLKNSFNKQSIKYLQFIYTDYFNSKDVVETEKLLRDTFNTPEKISEGNKKIEEFSEDFSREKEKYEIWIQSLSSKESNLVKYIQVVMEIRDWRKDPIAQAQTIFGNVCREMLSRAGIDANLAPYILPQELDFGVSWIENNKNQIMERQNGIVAFRGVDGMYEVSLDSFNEARNEVSDMVLKYNKSDSDLRGQVGSKGRISGIVKIVKDASLVVDFNLGNILVTGMTRPEFVPLMRIAGAIVTDEGGITCHAAIVSRELKIPCIIGTKVATKVLKDGDMVDVDADNGIVRIIEKAKK